MLEVSGASGGYGPIQILHGLSLRVDKAELVALVGSNGAGKTTLLRSISGLQPLTSGDIRLDGEPIRHMPAHLRVVRGLAHVPEGRQVFGPLSVEDNLRLGAYLDRSGAVARKRDRVFDLFPALAEKRHAAAGGLSGGQQQMLAIGRALMSSPRVLMLDEPSMGLAPNLVDTILDIVGQLTRDGMAILLVEQNAVAALRIATRGYVIETGRITQADTAKALLGDERLRAAYLGE
ncbi:ABC transporter ATP-binding protein [Bosea vaviloviae]|uniref:ABC transporter ATP-binding protein n=1 Tax=Bosea vaviloviae TaxID=1526658 RepID=A0A1D7UC19_9HYPH|nr:ABC transporter ATP-binding protein [Bosea vaviloviae]AOO84921.1 ABC transporter ATP-binding protein [Bosea vaviloviae]